MIKSMTGFAAVTREDEAGAVAVTIKSVNHRFLDLQLRVPMALAGEESRLRSRVQNVVARGRVELSIAVQPRQAASIEVEMNDGFVAAISLALERARERGIIEGSLTPGDLLRFPQALTIRERAADPAGAADGDRTLIDRAHDALDAALRELDEMRTTEGGYLKADLDSRRAALAGLIEGLAESAVDGAAELGTRISRRLSDLKIDMPVDDAVLAQEIVRLVSRSDISEEVVRFRAHLDHWQLLAESLEPCGRKLDFLLQEMNREINTIGSKAEGTRVPELIVAAKAELEKLREQVQNVE